jgi:hypothetical protein
MKKPTTILFFFLFITVIGLAQTDHPNSYLQDSLGRISSVIWKLKTDKERLAANENFFKIFQSILESDSFGAVTLDSIEGIIHVKSEDGKINMFTWNVPLNDGTNKYYGFAEIAGKKKMVVPLISAETRPEDLASSIFTQQSWYGALYYKLIEVKIGEHEAYTLLGWDGCTQNMNRKVIDILTIDNNCNIQFGLPVFKTDQGLKPRVVLEYAKKANVMLRYDFQAFTVAKGKKIKKQKAWLIVMDRLVPMDPSLKGMHEYYVPAGDTYDGYLFRNGYWVLVEDLDASNKTSKRQ